MFRMLLRTFYVVMVLRTALCCSYIITPFLPHVLPIEDDLKVSLGISDHLTVPAREQATHYRAETTCYSVVIALRLELYNIDTCWRVLIEH